MERRSKQEPDARTGSSGSTQSRRRRARLFVPVAVLALSLAAVGIVVFWQSQTRALAQVPPEPVKTTEQIITELNNTFAAELDGVQAVPQNTSQAIGVAHVVFNKVANTFDITLEIEGLALASVTGIKLQFGAVGVNGPVVVDLGTSGLTEVPTVPPAPVELTLVSLGVSFPAGDVSKLFAGNIYIAVYTNNTLFPNGELRGQLVREFPGPLSDVPVPLPPNLSDFVPDTSTARNAAIALGKALFWDMQVGSDGKTACATCHFHAGADTRTKNNLGLGPAGAGTLRGTNVEITANDFPFRKFADPDEHLPTVAISDTSEIFGSQGVVKKNFTAISPPPQIVDAGTIVPDPLFNFNGCNVRQVEPRNTPTMINAVFNDRNFWDGRANRFFNGVNPFGDTDPNARVYTAATTTTTPAPVQVCLDNASLASQAVGPPLSGFEMSWSGRIFPQVGRKMLPLRPLGTQKVHAQDSVLGPYANTAGLGLKTGVSYPSLIKQAFQPKWWQSTQSVTIGGKPFTHMEANFSLFWGISIMLYERTLVSDDSPFDRFAKAVAAGDMTGGGHLTHEQVEGFELFMTNGACIACHSGPEFTGAAISQVRLGPIEFMNMEAVPNAFYDSGFYNIGVRPTAEDLGVGGDGPFGAFALARRKQQGKTDKSTAFANVSVPAGAPTANFGAFKVPSLRNVELTGPYFHNGGQSNLEDVVRFYARGADFFNQNIDNLDPEVAGIGKVRGNPERVAAMAAFLRSLTDDRVRFKKAPFDHPELRVPNGHTSCNAATQVAVDNVVQIQAVGKNGSATPLKSFIDTINAGGFSVVKQ